MSIAWLLLTLTIVLTPPNHVSVIPRRGIMLTVLRRREESLDAGIDRAKNTEDERSKIHEKKKYTTKF